jgi:hypothetical protein
MNKMHSGLYISINDTYVRCVVTPKLILKQTVAVLFQVIEETVQDRREVYPSHLTPSDQFLRRLCQSSRALTSLSWASVVAKRRH